MHTDKTCECTLKEKLSSVEIKFNEPKGCFHALTRTKMTN